MCTTTTQCIFHFLRQSFIYFSLALASLCSQEWPCTSEPPTSTSQGLGLQACATMSGMLKLFKLKWVLSIFFIFLKSFQAYCYSVHRANDICWFYYNLASVWAQFLITFRGLSDLFEVQVSRQGIFNVIPFISDFFVHMMPHTTWEIYSLWVNIVM